MSRATEIEAAFAEIEEDEFTYDGADYACNASSYAITKRLAIGGQEVDADLSISVRKSVFSVDPSELKLITHQDKTFRINRTFHEPTGTLLRIICVSAT